MHHIAPYDRTIKHEHHTPIMMTLGSDNEKGGIVGVMLI